MGAHVQEVWGITPLLKVELVYSTQQVVCKPGAENTSASMLEMFDDLAESLTQLYDHFHAEMHPHDGSKQLTDDGWCTDPLFLSARYVRALGWRLKSSIDLLSSETID